MLRLLFFSPLLLLALCSSPAQGEFLESHLAGHLAGQQLPAFPGARGFGSNTVAGSGRHLFPVHTTVFKVSSLGDSGPKSLRYCVEQKTPRICVFEISGSLLLESSIKIKEPYLTIAGQTSPAPGIVLLGAGIEIHTHDVLIQHLAVRPGDGAKGPPPQNRDGVSLRAQAFNVVLDHLSVSWALDENVSTGQDGVRNVTISHSIIAEALDNSIHPKGPHSKGLLIGEGTKNISIHHCLFAHNVDRNPRLKFGTTAEFINNVVYHWGGRGGGAANVSDPDYSGSPILLNFAGNYYKPGPNTPTGAVLTGRSVDAQTRIYATANIGPSRPKNEGNQWLISNLPEIPYRSASYAFAPSEVSVLDPEHTYTHVLAHAGNRSGARSAVDRRIIEEVRNASGTFKNCVSGCSLAADSSPTLQANYREFSEPENPHEDDNQNGYTNLEEVLHRFAASVEAK
jgi:hypothetical protein